MMNPSDMMEGGKERKRHTSSPSVNAQVMKRKSLEGRNKPRRIVPFALHRADSIDSETAPFAWLTEGDRKYDIPSSRLLARSNIRNLEELRLLDQPAMTPASR
jgi:hypothetical protein